MWFPIVESTFRPNRKTKILATLGPSSRSSEVIRELITTGVNGFRFNFSHGEPEEHIRTLRKTRKICEELDSEVTCLADLQGPKIRVGELRDEPIEVRETETVGIYPASSSVPRDRDYPLIPIRHETLIEDFDPGDQIFLSEGQISLIVTDKREDHIKASAEDDGDVHSGDGVNIPNAEFSVPALTEKDRKDLEIILDHSFDSIALSFVRKPEDIRQTREIIKDHDKLIDLYAKIESSKALSSLDEILEESDGIIVARGDLGVEIGPERVPFQQKKMINHANQKGCIVITATQMLESMLSNSVPTRAEVSDVANAILDGSDTVMLSGETAVGDYPVRTVKTMNDIISVTEEDFREMLMEIDPQLTSSRDQTGAAICLAASRVANKLEASAIVAPTVSGFTARMVSKTYPICPIIALSYNDITRRKINLYQNVIPHPLEEVDSTDELIKISKSVARDMGLAQKGDTIVLIAGLPIPEPGLTNFLHVMEIS